MVDWLIGLGMAVFAVLVLVLFWKWNVKFSAERHAWRVDKVAEILYIQNTPSWEVPWERASELVKNVYRNRAEDIIKFMNRTAPVS